MLRVSKLADYGTLIMVHLARHEGQQHNAKNIANATGLGVPTVAKLLKFLTQAGLLTSSRGVQGGYALARSAPDISVGQIITAVEGEPGLTECTHAPGDCTLESICTTSHHWQVISRTINDALEGISLASFT